MLINFLRERTHRQIKHHIFDKMAEFAVEYDIVDDEISDWITQTEEGLNEFVNWLVKTKVFNGTPVIFYNHNQYKLFCGMNITEDELFTLTMMKIQ